MKIPAHKVTDPDKLPGQTVNPITEATLSDYLEKKYPEEMKKKLTFEEWYQSDNECIDWFDHYEVAKAAWKAGQENK